MKAVAVAVAVSAILGLVTMALAGSAGAEDWSGAYAGFTAGSAVNGGSTYYYSGVIGDDYKAEGKSAGLFIGYNVQRDALVYGAELSAQGANIGAYGELGSSIFSSIIDLKLRAGVSVGKALPYAFLGYSSGDWNNAGPVTNPRADGMNYGLGLDYQFNARMFGGLEYIYRKTETAFDQNANSVEHAFGTLQLRVGLRF